MLNGTHKNILILSNASYRGLTSYFTRSEIMIKAAKKVSPLRRAMKVKTVDLKLYLK